MKDLKKGDILIRKAESSISPYSQVTFLNYDGEAHFNPIEADYMSLSLSNYNKLILTGLEDLSKPTFKVGDRVIPNSKTTGDSFEKSYHIRYMRKKEQPFLYITQIRDFEISCSVNNDNNGDFFLESDLTLYEETNTPPCVHQSPEEKEEVAQEIVKERPHGPALMNLGGATKHDSGKPSFSAIPQLALMEVAKGFTHGKIKYGKFNYSGAVEATRLTDALQRHLNQYLTFSDKNDIDESGVHHLANVACNAMMLLDAILNKTVIDDRNQAYKK